MLKAKVNHQRRSGFTLVEMLVVVGIVTILAAILVPAVYMGLSAATDARIAIELSNLDAAMRSYKTVTHGYSSPPNFVGVTYITKYPSTQAPAAWHSVPAVVVEHIQQKFGRLDLRSTSVAVPPPTTLDPAEALVFWLRGYGNDPTNPLFGERKELFDFDESRLRANEDLNGDSVVDDNDTALDPTPVYYPLGGQKVPYVYIHHDSYDTVTFTGGADTIKVGGVARAYKRDGGVEYVNADSYQIISAGQDGDWGPNVDPMTNPKQFPSGLNYGPEDQDNITNFSEGTLADQIP